MNRRRFLNWALGILGAIWVQRGKKPPEPRYFLWDYHRPTGKRVCLWEIPASTVHSIADPKQEGLLYVIAPPLKDCSPPDYDYGEALIVRTDPLLSKGVGQSVPFLEIRVS